MKRAQATFLGVRKQPRLSMRANGLSNKASNGWKHNDKQNKIS